MSFEAFRTVADLTTARAWPELKFVNTLLAKYALANLATTNLWTLYQDSGQALPDDDAVLDEATMLALKNGVTDNIAARWDKLSPAGFTNPIKAWITVVGNDTLDADMLKHRMWRGQGDIVQVYDGTKIWDTEFPEPPPRPVPSFRKKVIALIRKNAKNRPPRLALGGLAPILGVTKVKPVKPVKPGTTTKPGRRRQQKAQDFGAQSMDTEAGDQGVPVNTSMDWLTSIPAKSSTPETPDVDMGEAEVHHSHIFRSQGVAVPGTLPSDAGNANVSSTASANVPLTAASTSSAYILYSAVYDSSTPTTTDASLEPGPLDDFVSNLDSGCLALNNALSATSSTSTLSTIDPWMQWLSAGALAVSNVTVTGTVDTLARITSVGASTSLFGATLDFNTASPILLPAADAAPTAPVPPTATTPAATATLPPAFLTDYELMVLGLATSNPRMDVKVKDILKAFGPTWLATLASLPGFGDQFDLTLDPNSGRRNGLFFQPDGDKAKHLRLEFDAPNPDQLGVNLGFMGAVTLTNTCLVAKMVGTKHDADQGATAFCDIQKEIGVQTTVTATNGGSSCTFDAWFDFKPDRTDLVITFPKPGTFDSIITWLLASLPSELTASLRPEDILPKTDFINVHQISVALSDQFSVLSASVVLEIDAFNAVFQVRLNYPDLRLSASLWTALPPSFSDYNLRMVPWWEQHDFLPPFVPANVTGGISLMSLFSTGTPTPPHGIEPILTEASFEVWRTPEKTINLSFSATVTSNTPDEVTVPAFELGELKLLATYQGVPAKDPQGSAFDVILSTTILLFPRDFSLNNPKSEAGEIDISVEYNGSWTVIAEAKMIQFAAIYSFFDDNAADSVMDILEQLSIPTFRAEYDYSNGSHLSITGTLRVHTLDLDLAYEYNSDSTWTFSASLHTIDSSPGHPNEIFISDLIKDFDPQSEVAAHLSEVPFIGQIGLPSVSADAGAFEDAPVQLKLCKSGSAFIMWFRIEIDSPAGALSFLFIQYNAAPTPAPAAGGAAGGTPASGSGSASANTRPKPKRLLRVQLNKLPKFPSIPIVGNIDQPVDSIDYILVQDSAASVLKAAGKDATPGFTRDEIKNINDVSA